jgi:TonB family protein
MRFSVSLLSVVVLAVPAVALAHQGRTPTRIKHVEPVYPEQARQARIQGTVILQITVDTAGRVSDARVIGGIPMLNQAALDAVKQWVYDTETTKTPVTLTVSVPFFVASAAPAVPTQAAVGSTPAVSEAGGAQGVPTAPLTTLRGFTVDVPAGWNRYESGGWQHAQSSDGQARVAIADDSGSLQSILAASEPNLQSIAHGQGRIFYRRTGQPGGYVIYVRLNDLVTLMNCQEKTGTEGGASGCLTIARTARFVGSSPASGAAAGPAVTSSSSAAPSAELTSAAPTSPPASPAGVARGTPSERAPSSTVVQQPTGTAPQNQQRPAPQNPQSTDAIPAGDVLPPGWRDFGNVAVGTTKTIRIVLPCNSLRIRSVSPPERQSEFRIMPSEPAMGRTAVANGRRIPFQCPSGNNCVHPFSFSPKSHIAQINVYFTCDTISHAMYGSAR